MKFKVNNEEVFASTGGRPFDKNKPLIIFVHGSGLTHMTWVLQTRYFAFHGYSVLALDLPGHGLSGGKSLKSIEEMAEWISSVIDAVEQLRSIGRRGINSRHICQLGEEGSFTFNIRSKTGVCDVRGGWGIRV